MLESCNPRGKLRLDGVGCLILMGLRDEGRQESDIYMSAKEENKLEHDSRHRKIVHNPLGSASPYIDPFATKWTASRSSFRSSELFVFVSSMWPYSRSIRRLQL